MKDRDFYTPTMAKIYIQQGYLGKAAEIYEYLLKQDPANETYQHALSEIEKQRPDNVRQNRTQLAVLFRQWIDLELKYQRLQKLRKLKIASAFAK